MQTKDVDRAREEAKAQLDSIIEMVKALEDVENHLDREEAQQTIQEDPLEVSIRSDWHQPGTKGEDSEYLILLRTGGPAVRIVGKLDQYGQPETASLEYLDWFTAWQRYPISEEEGQALLAYANCFYFGE